MSAEDELDELDKKSLKVLAESADERGMPSRIITDIKRAAASGKRDDFTNASKSFEMLPSSEKRAVRDGAVRKAETEYAPKTKPKVQIIQAPKIVAGKIAAPKAPTRNAKSAKLNSSWDFQALPDDPLMRKIAATKAKAKARKAEEDDLDDGQSWDWRTIPGTSGAKKPRR